MDRRAALLAGTGLASLLATGLSIAPRPAAAQLPTGGAVVGGAGTIAQTAPNRLTITQTTSSMAANWNSFSIGAGNVVQFVQPSSSAIALNRVVGPEPSVIAGSLQANGRLVLVNPNGLVFSQGSQVNVASLVATTANIPTADFMAGRLAFSEPGRPGTSVVNEGTITVAEGGLAALVAPEVRNSGTIRAQLGRVVLAGAESFTLDPRGDGLISFEVARGGPARETRAENTGRIEANGGTVQITAASARGIVSGVVNVGGEVAARSVGMQNGVVVFGSGEAGTTTVSGSVDVSGTGAGQTGGRATITGDRVRVAGTARIDARGSAGGGTVLVGGNIQGRGPEQNARQTAVDAGAVIRADATDRGNGGTVVVWSDQYTSFMGAISAQGGVQGGDGGFVEVSGKLWLGFNGTVDTRAPMGRAGTLLLDPTDITISTAANNDITATTPFEFTDNTAPPSTSGTSNLNVTTLQTALAAGNVVVSTTAGTGAPAGGTITVANAVTWTTANSLTLNASNGIAINAAITATADGNANGALSGALVLSTAAGGITQSGAGVIRAASVSATATAGSVVLGNTNNRIGSVSGTAGGAGATFGIVNSEALSAGAITTGTAGLVDLRAAAGTALTLNGAIDAGGGTAVFVADTLTLGVAGALGGAGANRVEIRTATAGRVIEAGAGAAGAGLALPTATLAALAPTAGTNPTLRIGSAGTVVGEAGSGVVTLTGLSTGALIVESASSAGTGAIVQTGVITAPSLQAIAPAGPVVLTGANVIQDGSPQGGVVSGQATAFSFNNASSFRAGAIDAGAGTVNLTSNTATVGQQAGTGITAGTLVATSNGAGAASAVVLDSTTNNVATIQGSVGGGVFTYVDANAVTASSIAGGTNVVSITSDAGTVTAGSGLAAGELRLTGQTGVAQTAAISVGTVVATSAAGSVTLENAGNTITTISGGAGAGQSFSVRDSNALAVGAVSVGNNGTMRFQAGAGSTLAINGTLSAPGTTSSATFIADAISATGGFGADRAASSVIRPVSAGTAINIGSGATGGLAISQGVADALAPAIGGTFRIGSLGTGGEAAAGQITITGLNVDQRTLELRTTSGLANAITQTGGLSAQALVATAPNGGVRLLDPNSDNQVGSFSATAGLSGVSLINAVGFQVDGISTTGDVSLRARTQSITQGTGVGAAIGGGAQTVTAIANAGSVALTNSANSATDVTGSAGGGSFAYTDANALTLLTVSATGNTTIIAGGDLTLPGFTTVSAGAGQRLQLQSGGELFIAPFTQFTVDGGTAVFAADTITGGTGASFFTGSIAASEIRTGTAGRGIALGSGNTATQLVLDNNVLGSLAPLGGAGTLRIGATGQVAGEVASGAVVVNSASLGNTTVVLESGANGTAISQSSSIIAANLAALAPNGGVVLTNSGNNVGGSVAGQAGAGGFAFSNVGTINVGTVAGTAGINATGSGDVALTVTSLIGNITQSAPIGADTLTVNANGINSTITLTNTGNAVNTLVGQSTSSLSYVDSNGLNTGAITTFSGGVTLTASGTLGINGTLSTPGTATLTGTSITQAAPILANNLVATGSAGDVVLTNAGNSVNGVGGAAQGAFSFTNANGVAVAGINAGNATLTVLNGNITQTGAITTSGTLTASAANGGVTLTNGGNENTGIAGVAGGNFSYTDATGFAVNGVSTAGGTLTLTATTGAITQGAGVGNRINAFGLSATAPGGVALDNAANTASFVSAGSTGGNVTYRDADGFTVGTVNANGTATLSTVAGNISQFGAITAAALDASAGGSVALTNSGNNVNTLSGAAGSGFSYTDANGFVVNGIAGGAGNITLTALSGTITQAAGAGGAVTGLGLVANANGAGGSVTLTNAANNVVSVGGTTAGDFAYTDATGFAVSGINNLTGAAGTVTLRAAAGSITQSGAINATALDVAAAGGSVTLNNAGNTNGTVIGSAGGDFAYTEANGFIVGDITAGAGNTVTLVATNGAITQSGALVAGTVVANATGAGGAVTLTNPGNDFGTIGGSATGAFSVVDSNGFVVSGITNTGSVTLQALAGSITQTGAIGAGSLAATATGGAVTLANAGNEVNSLGGGATGGFTYTDASGFTVTGINANASAVALTATGGGISQTGAITGGTLAANANGAGGFVILQNAGNEVAAVGGSSAGNFAFTDATGFAVSGIAASTGVVTLVATGGGITQTGAISAGTLSATAGAGAVTLTNGANAAGAVLGSSTGDFAFTGANGVSVSSIAAGGTVTLEAVAGAITQTGAISGTALLATATGAGGVVTLNAANNAGTVGGASTGGFAYTGQGGFTVSGIAAGGAATLTSNAGGIGQTGAITANGLVASAGGGAVDLQNAGNAVGTVSGSGAGFAFQDSGPLATGAITSNAGAVTLTAAGQLSINGPLTASGQAIALSGAGIDQVAPILGASLSAAATAPAGAVVLTNAGNDVALLGGAAGGSFAYTDATGVAVTGIAAGGAVTLQATGAIIQTGAITGTALTATAGGAAGAVTLTDGGNDVASIGGGATGAFAYTDATGFSVAGINAGGTVTLTAASGAITQTGAIAAAALSANATGAGGAVALTSTANSVASLGGGATGDFAYTNSTALSISGIAAGGNVALIAATGGITQTGTITTGPAGTLSVTADNGAVALTLAGNDAGTITGSAGTGFQYRDAGDLNAGQVTTTTGDISLAAGGNLALLGDVTAATVRLQAGGNLTQAAGSGITAQDLLAIGGGTVDLFSATNRVGTFAGGGDVVNFRNSESLIIGAVDGDATVNGGSTQFGVIATTAARITVGQAPGSPALLNLTVEQPVAAERIQLTIATGAGLLRINPNTLRGAGGAGTPSVVVLDVTGRLEPNAPDLVALPTFSGVGDRPPNVPIPIVLGTNVNADIDLTSQNMAGTSLYLLMNGGQAINSGGSLNVRGLALYPGTLPTTTVTFTGVTVNGQPGQSAASQGRLAVDPNSRFQINNCPIGTVSCVIQPLTVPGVPSVGEVPLGAPVGARPDEGSISLVNTGNEDAAEDEERRIAVGRPARPQESAR
jgi:filamentous hemagglutinin family protein